jgi:hypothetical protein
MAPERRSLVGAGESSPFDVGVGKVVSDEFVAGFSFAQRNLNGLIDHLIWAEFVQHNAKQFYFVFSGH